MILLLLLLVQDIEALSSQGALAMREKRYAEAVRIYSQAAAADRQNPMWRMNLGLALSYAGRHQEAVSELSAFLKARPAPGPAHFVQGLSLLKLGRYCDAVAPLETAEKWKSTAEVFIELGDAYQGCKRWELAAAAYERASRMNPTDKRLPRQAAHGWWMARRYEKAQSAFASLDKSQFDNPELLFEYGDTLVRTEGPEAGLPLLEKASAAAPRLLAARSALGRALLDLNRPADALPHLEAAAPENPALLLSLSRAYRALGRDADAARTEALYKSKMR